MDEPATTDDSHWVFTPQIAELWKQAAPSFLQYLAPDDKPIDQTLIALGKKATRELQVPHACNKNSALCNNGQGMQLMGDPGPGIL